MSTVLVVWPSTRADGKLIDALLTILEPLSFWICSAGPLRNLRNT
jgi:hypothetical protein